MPDRDLYHPRTTRKIKKETEMFMKVNRCEECYHATMVDHKDYCSRCGSEQMKKVLAKELSKFWGGESKWYTRNELKKRK